VLRLQNPAAATEIAARLADAHLCARGYGSDEHVKPEQSAD